MSQVLGAVNRDMRTYMSILPSHNGAKTVYSWGHKGSMHLRLVARGRSRHGR